MPKRYLTIIFAYFILLFSGAIGAPIVQSILKALTNYSSEAAGSLAVVIWTIFSNLLTLFIIWLVLRKQPEQNKIVFGEKTSLGKSLLWSVLGFVILIAAQYLSFFIIALFVGMPSGSENTESLLNYAKSAPIFLFFIGITGPILEELVFRKVIYGGLANMTNIHVAAVISSFIFALLHGDISYLLAYFVIGLVLCYLYTKTKRIIVPMGAHILMNCFVLILGFVTGG
ncbi:metal-dependent membrane protease [Listeria floridensis FSL S10-1187]|uniref:Metal-dependent membrane protease n=1 Tax=Listeria floridensis FSL S10-1187 TaxID=1265817 RepID=A0ABN0RFM8_9LIST|nr:type II CAAX endopeptidase family protein [Listeria floridensis]EUJ32043.1 metal-dependent membrane protease [Listeria floridensis FSL S10-1187]